MTPLVSVRKVVAERMLASLQSTAQLTLSMQARAVHLKKARQRYKDQNLPITINDVILYVVARVLADHTDANSILIGNTVISYKQVNLGFAVQTEKGLMVPVIKNAHEKSIETISEEVKQLSHACKQGTISSEQLQGGTFTVSNLGAWGIQVFTPVLNAPQTGIFGIGGIDIRAIEISDGTYGFEPCLHLSFTFDHRAYDGADAADILKACSDAISECTVEL